MNQKIISYLGFAKKSGNLVSGVNTCMVYMAKGKVKLLIVSDDISQNGEKKLMKEVRKQDIPYVRYGMGEEISHAVGERGRTVFAVCDKNFAEVILNEIVGEKDKGGSAYENKGTGSRA